MNKITMATGKALTALCSIAVMLTAGSTPVMAGEAASAWGTVSTNTRALVSATLHKTEGDNAQIASVGNGVSTMYRSISSCGYCVYNQITGNQNSINGNTITGSNSGQVTSTGNFGSN